MDILYYIIIAVASYFLGSISVAVIISKYILKKDVRERGSKNAGATNVARVFGMGMGLLTLLGDFLKTAIAMYFGRWLMGDYGMLLAALMCFVGHCWPVFFSMRGGKGVAVGGCIGLMIDWRLFAAIIGVFLIVFAFTRIVSISSMIAAVAFPVTELILGLSPVFIIFGCILAGLIIFLHRGNIKRLINHTEAKFVPKGPSKSGEK